MTVPDNGVRTGRELPQSAESATAPRVCVGSYYSLGCIAIRPYKPRRNPIYNHLIISDINRASGYIFNNPALERSDYVGKAERSPPPTTVERLQTQLKEKLKLSVEDILMLDSQRIRRPDRTRITIVCRICNRAAVDVSGFHRLSPRSRHRCARRQREVIEIATAHAVVCDGWQMQKGDWLTQINWIFMISLRHLREGCSSYIA